LRDNFVDQHEGVSFPTRGSAIGNPECCEFAPGFPLARE
jgi:hypothetical protein